MCLPVIVDPREIEARVVRACRCVVSGAAEQSALHLDFPFVLVPLLRFSPYLLESRACTGHSHRARGSEVVLLGVAKRIHVCQAPLRQHVFIFSACGFLEAKELFRWAGKVRPNVLGE